MSQEEFQKIVLEKLNKIDSIEKRLEKLEKGQDKITSIVENVEKIMYRIENKALINDEFIEDVNKATNRAILSKKKIV